MNTIDNELESQKTSIGGLAACRNGHKDVVQLILDYSSDGKIDLNYGNLSMRNN